MLNIEPNKYRVVRVGIEKQILEGGWEWIYVARFHLVAEDRTGVSFPPSLFPLPSYDEIVV